MPTRLLRSVVCTVLALGPICSIGCAARTYPLVGEVQLALRVKTAIINDPVVGTQPVDVRAEAGAITLTGQVGSADHIDRLLVVARGVPGVVSVVSELTVAPPNTQPVVPASPAPPGESRSHLIGLGAGVRMTPVTADSLGTALNIFPIVRLPNRHGFGPAIGLNWLNLPIDVSPAGTPGLGVLRLRAVMLGLSWSRTMGRSSVSASAVGGWSFTDVESDPRAAGAFRAIHGTDSFVWRPSVSLWQDLDDRFGLYVFAGGLFANPRVTFASDDALVETRIATQTLIVRVGMAYWVF